MNDDDQHGGSGGTAPDPTGSEPPVEPSERRLSPPLIAALVLGAVLVVGIGVAGIVLGPSGTTTSAPAPRPAISTGPLLLVPVDAPQAGSPDCAALLRALPATLPNGKTPLHSRQLASPAPPATMAWGGTAGEPAVLRCGIERPPELTATSELLDVNSVQWLRISADGATTWYAVDRAVVVALTLPGDVGTGPIQQASDTISATLPAKPVF
ncbi:MAG TPA: DUF3515 domain-containing protein [Pseudonocardiaceae bacterium]|nr:DUF3515 domain-containing protein [Pseudonocardiaceae bacterium]